VLTVVSVEPDGRAAAARLALLVTPHRSTTHRSSSGRGQQHSSRVRHNSDLSIGEYLLTFSTDAANFGLLESLNMIMGRYVPSHDQQALTTALQ